MGTKEEYWRNRSTYLATSRRYHHSEHGRNVVKAWWQKQKTIVLTHYGGGVLACVKCGYSDIRALSIDHIDGGGTQLSKLSGRPGSKLYRWLINSDFPEGYQTLCMNCQWVKRVENNETSKVHIRTDDLYGENGKLYGSGGKKR